MGAAYMCLYSTERLTTTAALFPVFCLVGLQGRLPLAPCCYLADITAGIPTLPVFGSCQTYVNLELNEKGTEQIQSFVIWVLFCLAFPKLNLVSSKQVG